MTTTYWQCDLCLHFGEVDHREHAGAMEVAHKVADAHKASNPACVGSEWEIRVSIGVPISKPPADT